MKYDLFIYLIYNSYYYIIFIRGNRKLQVFVDFHKIDRNFKNVNNLL